MLGNVSQSYDRARDLPVGSDGYSTEQNVVRARALTNEAAFLAVRDLSTQRFDAGKSTCRNTTSIAIDHFSPDFRRVSNRFSRRIARNQFSRRCVDEGNISRGVANHDTGGGSS